MRARWSPKLENCRALSIKQPWAWLIVNGFKDVENRSRRTHHRGPLLIHSGLDKGEFNDDMALHIKRKYGVDIPETLEFGGVVGVANVVDCSDAHSSPWFVGDFAWVLADPRRLSFRPCKGALGLFKPVFES
ncbi:ASCH domain-containing protein [Hyphomicrobium sp.]|uniref:ASCH domain-containing protein n=1 Tax=Hyphomicrobium sp. TaxID=82 RepID=UPI000F94624E|nr:MAG: ASCH domain-containing protein [Hyphomicrobium sp.]